MLLPPPSKYLGEALPTGVPLFRLSSPLDWIFASEREGAVVANLKRKEHDAQAMADALSQETLAAVQANVLGTSREHNPYIPAARVIVPSFMEAA